MTIKAIRALGPAILVLAGSTAFAETTNCTVITHLPYVINKEGIYCLRRNLSTSISSGDAIEINKSNVTIDLNGYRISGLLAGKLTRTNGIYSNKKRNIKIRNGSIRGFYRAVYLDDDKPFTASRGNLIEDIHADRNTFMGFRVFGSNNIVRRNQVIDTGGSKHQDSTWAISFVGPGGRLVDNDIHGVRAANEGWARGIGLWDSNATVVEGNRINAVKAAFGSSGKGLGVSCNDATRDVVIVGNRIIDATNGIYFAGVSTGKYMNNVTSGVDTSFYGENATAVGIND